MKTLYGTLGTGEAVYRHDLESDQLHLSIIDYGARLARLDVRVGDDWRPVILSLPSLAAYESDGASVGAMVGRYANRIANASFKLDSQSIKVAQNEGDHHLHGGVMGFANRCWAVTQEGDELHCRLSSRDGEEGFPGNLVVELVVSLKGTAVELSTRATTDKPTVINLTQHGYFNLEAADNTVLDHRLMVNADRYVEVTSNSIPTGRLLEVDNTPLDFRKPARLGDGIITELPGPTAGFDHCLVLNHREPEPAARLLSDDLEMQVFTSEPGLQLYTANDLTPAHQYVCLEAQHFPDSPNHAGFPSTRLDPGQTFQSTTVLYFIALND